MVTDFIDIVGYDSCACPKSKVVGPVPTLYLYLTEGIWNICQLEVHDPHLKSLTIVEDLVESSRFEKNSSVTQTLTLYLFILIFTCS